MNILHVAFVLLGIAGLLGCYDIARRMTLRTRHGMRLAVITIGVACVLAIGAVSFPDLEPAALLLLLIGCGLYRLFDKRAEGWNHGRASAGASGFVATQQAQWGQPSTNPSAAAGHAVAGGLHLAAVRQDPVRRQA